MKAFRYLIGRETASALRALLVLASHPGKVFDSYRLTRMANLKSRSSLVVYLRRLHQAGIVACFPGGNGGYCLLRSPDTITLKEAVQAAGLENEQGVDRVEEFLLVNQALIAGEQDAMDVLSRYTLARLLDGETP